MHSGIFKDLVSKIKINIPNWKELQSDCRYKHQEGTKQPADLGKHTSSKT
jgi:hypothetical protein